MLQRGSHPRLGQKPLAERDVLGEVRREQLQRDVTVEREIASPVDDAHPAAAEQRLQPIAGQLRPDGESAEAGMSLPPTPTIEPFVRNDKGSP